MDLVIDIAFILGAYIFGSLPHLALLAKLRHVSIDGDYHMSLWQKAGKWVGISGILLEFAKGAIPVLVGQYMGVNLTALAIGGVATVCGQMWPVFQKFDGEKGNTTGVGIAAALDYRPFLIAAVPFAVGAGTRVFLRMINKRRAGNRAAVLGGPFSRSMPLGMFTGFLVLPLASWLLGEPLEITWAFLATFILIVARRLTAGIGRDLKTGIDIKRMLIGRLFLDRGVGQYRAE
jgi:glycerol-3-phosphate acyltransferase PlsY